MKPLILNQSADRVPAEWLERWVKSLSRQLERNGHAELKKKELVIVFVKNTEMRHLNKVYRGKNYATDVLSFESADPSSLGEIVLCMSVLKSQSKRTGLSERGELGYMIVHGVLHLLGYDHGTKAQELEMFALQDEIYATLEKKTGLR